MQSVLVRLHTQIMYLFTHLYAVGFYIAVPVPVPPDKSYTYICLHMLNLKAYIM